MAEEEVWGIAGAPGPRSRQKRLPGVESGCKIPFIVEPLTPFLVPGHSIRQGQTAKQDPRVSLPSLTAPLPWMHTCTCTRMHTHAHAHTHPTCRAAHADSPRSDNRRLLPKSSIELRAGRETWDMGTFPKKLSLLFYRRGH